MRLLSNVTLVIVGGLAMAGVSSAAWISCIPLNPATANGNSAVLRGSDINNPPQVAVCGTNGNALTGGIGDISVSGSTAPVGGGSSAILAQSGFLISSIQLRFTDSGASAGDPTVRALSVVSEVGGGPLSSYQGIGIGAGSFSVNQIVLSPVVGLSTGLITSFNVFSSLGPQGTPLFRDVTVLVEYQVTQVALTASPVPEPSTLISSVLFFATLVFIGRWKSFSSKEGRSDFLLSRHL
jgi:hypothetical protein